MGTYASGNHREGEGILVTSRARLRGFVCWDVRASSARNLKPGAGSAIFAIIAIGVVKKNWVSISEVSFR